MARPTLATPDTVETIELALARGTTVRQAAAAAGVSTPTLQRWLREGVVSRRRLRAVPDDHDDVVESGVMIDDERVESAMVAAVLKGAAVDWRAAAWLLERRWPVKWGRRE